MSAPAPWSVMRSVFLTLLFAAGAVWVTQRPVAAGGVDLGRTDVVTPALGGVPLVGIMSTYGMSDDGRAVLFDPGPNFASHPGQAIFVRDMEGGYRPISTSPDGSSVNGFVSAAVLSGDGDTVAFASNATDATTGARGSNLYLAAVSSGTVRLISRLPGTMTAANAVTGALRITPDGRYVVFGARGPRLDVGPYETIGGIDLYRYDALTDVTTAITVADGVPAGAGDSDEPSISDDGRYVAFTSSSGALTTPHVANAPPDLYLRDVTAGTTTLVSHAAVSASQRTGGASEPMISADGGTVVFVSSRTTAVTSIPARDGWPQVVVWQRATGVNRLVSRSPAASAADLPSGSPKVSGDGSVIAFLTQKTDLIAGVTDANTPAPGVYPSLGILITDAYAEVNGALRLLSHAEASTTRTGNQGVNGLVLSRDGRRAAFSTVATDLVTGLTDAGIGADLYAADTGTGSVRAASLDGRSSILLAGDNRAVAITPDGSQLAFSQTSSSDFQVLRSIPRRRAFGPVLPSVPPVPRPVGTVTPPTPPGVLFHPLTPTRILDSRPAGPTVGPYATPWTPGSIRNVTVAGEAGVPADAGAVVVNATVTNTSEGGYLTIWPAGDPQPIASNLNWLGGQTIPNAATVKVGAGGQVSVFNAGGTADIVFDLVGYYDGSGGDGYTPLTPNRILDSRPGGPQSAAGAPWAPGQTRGITVAGIGGVPADADAVLLNATVTNASSNAYLTVWPAGQVMPFASSMNWTPRTTIANAVTSKVGAGGKVSVFSSAGTADVIFNVVGYFRAGTGDAFHPTTPSRIQDSRTNFQQPGPWRPGDAYPLAVARMASVPDGVTAALLNLTATGTTSSSYATVWPDDEAMPLASSLNWSPGHTKANSVTAKLGTGKGGIFVRNAAGTAHIIVDVAGWYG